MRYPILGLVLALGLLCVTPTGIAVTPSYPQHVGSDDAKFEHLRIAITDEENRRRSDDQEHRQRLTEHDRLIGGLIKQGDSTERRMERIEGWFVYVFIGIAGVLLTLVVNTVFTVKTHWAINVQKAKE